MTVEIGQLLNQATDKVAQQVHGSEGEKGAKRYLHLANLFIGQGFDRLNVTPDSEGKTLEGLEKWYADDSDGKKKKLLTDVLNIALNIFPEAEKNGATEPHLLGTVGHDSENASNMAGAALEMIDGSEGKIGSYASWELLTCALVENLGRLYEGDDFTHQTTGFLLAKEIIKQIDTSGLEESPELQQIYKRVMSRIYGHGTVNAGDPNLDLVAQINRLQNAGGQEWLMRILPYDVGSVGQDIFTSIDDVRQVDMSHTFAKDASGRVAPTVMDWGEFLVRNLFDFSTEANKDNPDYYREVMMTNQERANKRRADGVAILTILAGGEGTSLYKQVFATDLELSEPRHWSKKKINVAIFQEGMKKYREFKAMPPEFPGLEGLTPQKQIEAILRVGNSVLPESVFQKIIQHVVTDEGEEQLADALRFALNIHYQDLDIEVVRLGRQVKSSDPSVARVAEFRRARLEGKVRLD